MVSRNCVPTSASSVLNNGPTKETWEFCSFSSLSFHNSNAPYSTQQQRNNLWRTARRVWSFRLHDRLMTKTGSAAQCWFCHGQSSKATPVPCYVGSKTPFHFYCILYYLFSSFFKALFISCCVIIWIMLLCKPQKPASNEKLVMTNHSQ